MKFKKKDIDKLINILQAKKKELKYYDDDTLFEIIDKNTFICTWKEPERYVVKANNSKEGKILGKYVAKQYNQTQWLDKDINQNYYLHIDCGNYKHGNLEIQEYHEEITFEEFEKYIINK